MQGRKWKGIRGEEWGGPRPGGPSECACLTHLFSAGSLLLAVSQFTYVRTSEQNGWNQGSYHLDPCQLLFQADNILDVIQDLYGLFVL